MEIVYTYSLEILYSFENKEYEALNPEIFEMINSKEIRDYVTYKPSKQTTNFLFRNVEMSDEDIIKRINGLLNKITENNFDKIYDKINSILKNDNIIDKMIDKVFDKAIIQTSFCKLYAQICAKFCNNQEEEVLATSIKESLLRKCNEMYIECLQEDDYEKVNTHNYEEFCKYMKNKKKLIGIFHFMGNLHKQKLASDKDILTYINLLIKKIRFYQKIDKIEQEQKELLENLSECLCKLIQTVQSSLEILKDLIELEYQIECFIKDEEKFTTRIRFMFLDIQDILKKLNSKPKYVAKSNIKVPSSFSSKRNNNYSGGNKNWKNNSTKDYSGGNKNWKSNSTKDYSGGNKNWKSNSTKDYNKQNKYSNRDYSNTSNNKGYSDNRSRNRNKQGNRTRKNSKNNRNNRNNRNNQDYYSDKQSSSMTNTYKPKYNRSQKNTYDYDNSNSEYKSFNTSSRKYNSSSHNGYKRKKDNRRYKDKDNKNEYEYENPKTEKTEELKNKRFDILD